MLSQLLLATTLLCNVLGSNPLAWMDERNDNWDSIDHLSSFNNWKQYFNKEYENTDQESHRFKIFLDNWKMINDHNTAKKYNYTMLLNQFGDMTHKQFLYYVHGHAESCLKKRKDAVYKQQHELSESDELIKPKVNAPKSIDWTNINGTSYVTPVKDQGNCGACWAFSTVGSLESFAAIKNGWTGSQIVELSEQQLVDCTYKIPNGCQGGDQSDGFAYIAKEGGLCAEKEYPYTGHDGTCKASSCGTLYDTTKAYVQVKKDDEEALMDALAIGPIALSVDAAGPGWQHYHSGVYSVECGPRLDHGVVGVGYGTSTNGGDYWKIKNSWGTSWGMDGYMLLCRNCTTLSTGQCGILEDNTYPTF